MTQNVLITGANRGIGLEFCQQYLAAGARVFACCRTPQQATELNALANDYRQLTVLPLDIASHQQAADIVTQLNGVTLDVLINNAGIYGAKGASLEAIDAEEWLHVLHIDAIAPVLLTRTLQPLLGNGSKVAFVSSKMGSIADNQSGGSYMYRSAKAALNAAVKSLAIDWHEHGIRIALLHPGWVKTDMGGPNALISTDQSVAGMKNVIDSLSANDNGQFINYDGAPIPW
ncbi:SDR family oxidoreductase [Neiella sp. HB171785]|uniref:SDR family oxidoreductase n=1 Tax=Neiella litorisoli TaxID=2771431 RepID=A0A8J6QKC7_9GAMM|nr:SDR family oxidoreductase [Neiella litorisoli]MBD1389727.1 SDR family oxidoreductase [Neiella litorisoli]